VQSIRLGSKQAVDSPKYEVFPRNTSLQTDDKKDYGVERASILLRFSWSLQSKEFVYVWLQQLVEGKEK
jgi:hypothetical protein